MAKVCYMVREMTEVKTIGLFGNVLGAIFAIGHIEDIFDVRNDYYGKACSGLRESGVFTIRHNGKEYEIYSYELNKVL
jgi:hypothetical protein